MLFLKGDSASTSENAARAPAFYFWVAEALVGDLDEFIRAARGPVAFFGDFAGLDAGLGLTTLGAYSSSKTIS